jgi:hypothetical protein
MPPVFSRSKKVVKKRKCVARPKARGGRHESSPGLYQNSQGTLLPVPFLYKKMSSTTSTMYSLPLFCFPCHPSSSGSVCFFFCSKDGRREDYTLQMEIYAEGPRQYTFV